MTRFVQGDTLRDVTPGATIADRYVVLEALGDGGLASAFLVRDRALDVEVALKLIGTDAASREILRREFLALRGSRHPHLVRVHDFGYWRTGQSVRAFYTAALAPGVRLDAFARGRSWETIARPIGDVLSALASLHRRGLLHGDVHPRNVLVDDAGRAVLIDLSCARPLSPPAPMPDPGATTISGTPGFLAPELLAGTVHRTADLYALGIALRGLGLELPARVAGATARLVAERPEDRPASAEEAAVALGVPWAAPPVTDLLGCMLVGRDAALARARAILDTVSRGEGGPRALLLTGAAGSGRSRLLDEIKAAAQLHARTVLVRGRRGALATLLEIASGGSVAPRTSAALGALDRLATRGETTVLLIDDADDLPPEEQARLAALLRSLPPLGPVLVAFSMRAGSSLGPGVTAAPYPCEEIRVAPLSPSQLRAWLHTEIPERSLDAIVQATGGSPHGIAAVLAQLDGGAWDSRTLARAFRDADAASQLDEAATVAARRESVARAERALAGAPDRDDLLADLVVQLAPLDRVRAADTLLSQAPPSASPVVLRRAADALVLGADGPPPAASLRCAEIYADAGEPARALALVARSLRRLGRDAPAARDVLRRLAGQCYAQMGDSRRAVAVLERLLPRAAPSEQARVRAALSLAFLKRGDDTAAAATAASALASDGGMAATTRLDLLLNAAFARSRLGSAVDARAYLARAREIADGASPRGRFRLASAVAFVEYGAGETLAAMRAYEVALDLAEESGLDDLVPSAALNFGSACHEIGDLGRALDAYARGQRLATALGMPTTEVTLEFDRAKVHADIGNHERAALHASAARALARREAMPLLEAGAVAVLAEVATARGRHEDALHLLDQADDLAAGTSDRERVALALQRARARLAAGDLEGAEAAVASAEPNVRSSASRDVEASWLGTRSAVAVARDRAREGSTDAERALELAAGTGQRGLLAELEARAAEAARAAGSIFLAERHSARARELWEKALSTLPPELHDAFRRHPARASTFADARSPPAAAVPPGEGIVDLRRVLEINRRLNSASSTAAVLEETMDAAISLTRAERGFLLVAPAAQSAPTDRRSALKVAVARNVDRETIRQGNLKFSRTVAERVVRTGEPVIAVDAGFDPRFARAASVHAMKLKSLLCVPIRSPEGNLGAIYVDHRFSAGSFRPELVELLLALGDQAALALIRARLVEDLRQKTRELEERNAEVELLARGQALEIARLKRQELAQRGGKEREARSERRFDYGDMIAGSAPMRRILEVLDRVIDTDVTVLVRGESGTGKERIARAVHANSARAGGPFVAINCGALPESLLEAELFGYRRGAFSGAIRDQPGLFVSAKGGTLFLDELGEMAPSMQVKLLRVLQEHEVRPLGANEAVSTDVRLVCATNRDLAAEVRAGRFREDLFYRVAVVDVELPPLRDRIEDLLPLAEATLARLSIELGRPAARLERAAERALLAHGWPGNVRELENVLTKAFLLGKGGSVEAEDLELGATSPPLRGPSVALRARIGATLEEVDWNVVVAARLLGIPRATLYRKMRRFGIERPARDAR